MNENDLKAILAHNAPKLMLHDFCDLSLLYNLNQGFSLSLRFGFKAPVAFSLYYANPQVDYINEWLKLVQNIS